jgi:hypothetical protein
MGFNISAVQIVLLPRRREKMDIGKELLVFKADMVAKGYAVMEDEGLTITLKGKEAAYDLWCNQSYSDRFLLTWIVKNAGQFTEGKDNG